MTPLRTRSARYRWLAIKVRTLAAQSAARLIYSIPRRDSRSPNCPKRSPEIVTRSCSPESRAAYWRIHSQGWIDAIRALRPKEPMYTFWDDMRNRWERDSGLRLDHILLSSVLTKRLQGPGVDRHIRGREDASDAPVWVELRDAPNRRLMRALAAAARQRPPRRLRRKLRNPSVGPAIRRRTPTVGPREPKPSPGPSWSRSSV
jgi:hypothetical protein